MTTEKPEYEKTIKLLEESGDYRILRKIKRPQFSPTNIRGKVVAILDIETTGLDINHSEIIELGIIKVCFSEDYSLIFAVEEFQSFIEPSRPIPEEITHLTGIDHSLVFSKEVDLITLKKVMKDVTLVIAHNASFDRKFCEKKWPLFKDIAWGCSLNDIPWKKAGFPDGRLGTILQYYKYFHEGHRAIEDCYAVFQILTEKLPSSSKKCLQILYENSQEATIRIYAEGSPFEAKETLKKRGYKWSSSLHSWWIDLSERDREAEILFLQDVIYRKKIDVPIKTIDAKIRYSERANL